MKFSVKYWDDRNDCPVRELIIHASNCDEAEEQAKEILRDEGDQWVYERYPVLVESIESTDGDRTEEDIQALSNELREFGIETYLHEKLGHSIEAQTVLSKFCAETIDRMSEEDLDALTETVITNVEDELR